MALKESLELEADNVLSEAWKADEKYGDFTSTHEAYGVLAEEVAELLDAIRSNLVVPIAMEARQVAAVALRLAEICERHHQYGAPLFGARSNL
jgi:NTP pyrophosphatase (non-canonical NTP hydrolase)